MSKHDGTPCGSCKRPTPTQAQWDYDGPLHGDGNGCQCDECVSMCWGDPVDCARAIRDKSDMATVYYVLDQALSKPLFNPEIYAALVFGCFVVWGWQPETAYAVDGRFHYEMTFVAPAYADKINVTLRV